MAEQITTISRSKMVRYIGSLTEKFMVTRIDKTMLIQLGMTIPESTGKKSAPIEVPIWHKASLTVEEAAEYSNIGINRIRELCKEPGTNFAFQIGRKILIKREAFDEYLRNVKLL